MKSDTAFSFVVFCIIFMALNLIVSTGQSANAGAQELGLTSHPGTNESVEDGLRKNRDALRASAKFQTNDALTHLQLATILS